MFINKISRRIQSGIIKRKVAAQEAAEMLIGATVKGAVITNSAAFSKIEIIASGAIREGELLVSLQC